MSTTNRKDEALSWLMLTGMLSARRCTKASKEKMWEEMYDSCKIMSKAVGFKNRRRLRRQEPCGP